MPTFDEVFADLQAKMAAAMQVIASNPEVAADVRRAIEEARAAEVVAEEERQDQARANALNNLVLGVRETLAQAAPDAIPVPAEPSVDVVEVESGGQSDPGADQLVEEEIPNEQVEAPEN